jgi:protein disulfide-isomerase A6
MLLGYIRDTSSHSVLSALGVYDSADSSRDATRVMVWKPDASRVELIEYDGASALPNITSTRSAVIRA